MAAFRLPVACAAILTLAAAGAPMAQPAGKSAVDDVRGPGVRRADLSVRYSGPTAVTAGDPARFTVMVANRGPAGVGSGEVQVSGGLPDGLQLGNAGGARWSCRVAGATFTCAYAGGELAPGALAAPITLEVRVAREGAFNPCVRVTGPGEDLNPDDDRACLDVRARSVIRPAFDVGVRKQALGPAAPGQPVRFSVTPFNNGPGALDASSGVRVVELLPPGFTGPLLASGAGWMCSGAGRTITCDYAGPLVMAGGAFAPISLSAQAGGGPRFEACATVSLGRVMDRNPRDNRACARGELAAPGQFAGLNVRKTGPANLRLGESARWTLDARNDGGVAIGAADGVTLTDTLPTQFTQVRASGLGWTCTVSSGTPAVVGCRYVGPPVAPNAPLPPVTLTAIAGGEGPFVNCTDLARRPVPTGPIGPSESRGCSEGRVQRLALPFDVGIRKSGPSAVSAGQRVTYVVTPLNAAPQPLDLNPPPSNPVPFVEYFTAVVRVSDTLPPMFVGPVVADGGPAWTCSVAGLAVSCTHGGGVIVPAGAPMPQIRITATAAKAGTGQQCATVSIGGAYIVQDLAQANNRACVAVAVQGEAPVVGDGGAVRR
ncbi:DUF11 domain-containing protein [Phenylobacterium sp. J367]|uniref:DUF11 domain-containing protein n=1 Tax=Phenylobacterium sp. J367 TaxID=2898435 RepID=UPI002150AA06|nr:DUF11 domain-containing protein [Phenylobacterium sp. J367]MCR5879650.1 DUF11 domain-containing protein [Phenylobacterium sp. J367]